MSVWEMLARLRESLTPEDRASLPPDLAAEHDHYCYGTPKNAEREAMSGLKKAETCLVCGEPADQLIIARWEEAEAEATTASPLGGWYCPWHAVRVRRNLREAGCRCVETFTNS